MNWRFIATLFFRQAAPKRQTSPQSEESDFLRAERAQDGENGIQDDQNDKRCEPGSNPR